MPLEKRLRTMLYAAVAVLFLTGAAWLAADAVAEGPGLGAWAGTGTLLLMIHGGAAMALLLLLGALFPLHVLPGWRLDRNRASGGAMVVLDALLIVTAFGLYYLGSEQLRAWTSDLHIGFGLALPPLLLLHVVLGKRAAARRRRAAMAENATGP